MKILLVADFYPPAPGGLEAHVQRLGRALARSGHRVAVLAGSSTVDSAPSTVDGVVPVYRTGLSLDRMPGLYRDSGHAYHPPWPDRTFVRRLRQLLAEFDPDVVHAHGWCQFSAAAACHRRWPLVVTLHDYGLRCPKKNLLRGGAECLRGRGPRCVRCAGEEQGAVKRTVLGAALGYTAPRLAGRVRRVIAVSGHVARRYLETGGNLEAGTNLAAGTNAARVVVIPNFLDPLEDSGFCPPAGDEVLYVGPADRHKGLAVLLRARQFMPAELARLVVVGAGAPAGDPESGVRYTGRLTGEALWQRYRSAAVVAVPSIWPEPCPTVVLEALALGRPVVASRTGGLPDLVAHERTGVLVPPGDPRALGTAIADLLRDRPRLCAMAQAAHRGSRAFGTDVVVGRIQALYEEVCAECSR